MWDKMNRVKLTLSNGYVLSIIQPSENTGGVVETALLDPDGNFIPLDPKNCGTVTCPRIYPEDDVQQNLNSTDLVSIILKAKSYADRNYPFSTREASQNNERFGWSTQDHV
jgi:hypothetical protein